MCGLSGLIHSKKASLKRAQLAKDVAGLLLESQVRGQDAAGASFVAGDISEVIKRNGDVKSLLTDPQFDKKLLNILSSDFANFVFLGQSRLATNGIRADFNNQPLESGESLFVHNGIVTEIDGALTFEGHSESDSVQMFQFIEKKIVEKATVLEAVKGFFAKLRGSATISLVRKGESSLTLATNTGSLYYVHSPGHFFCFSSEKLLLERFLARSRTISADKGSIKNLNPLCGMQVNTETCDISYFELPSPEPVAQTPKGRVVNAETVPPMPLVSLKRCSVCILPSTYPFIEFDESGVCTFCRRYSRQKLFGFEELEKILAGVRSKDGSPDCLVGLSGGRDSCYGLHLLKTRFGMNPIAYTFDWGLTTEVSRRNQARLCGQLGVEHIIRSADLSKKRSYIKNNIDAFLKSPHLGMVPLFMAGDKEFYQYGRTLRDKNKLPLTVMCTGQSLEQRDFMTGFCGVDENIANNKRFYAFNLASKVKLSLFYTSQYIKNPAYINSSLVDSIKAFFFSFIFKDDFLNLYEYVPWNESEIENEIIGTYGWESDKSYGSNQWRMGDGQTAFTNFIYYTVAGFSEYDNFRSNQIREGLVSRDEALRLVSYDNQPKMEMLKYFADVTGIDLEYVMNEIRKIPKLY